MFYAPVLIVSIVESNILVFITDNVAFINRSNSKCSSCIIRVTCVQSE